MQPLVSVILPVYNAQNYIADSVGSILDQDYTNIELLVINDGSTDDSVALLSHFNDNRLQIISFAENKGLVAALNHGFAIAKGEYVARMDADDIALKDRLSTQVQFLEMNKEIGLCGSFARVLENKKPAKIWRQPVNPADIRCSLLFYACIIHPTVMLRASVLKELGSPYDPDFKHAEDYELWCRIHRDIKMANIARPLIDYRWHDQQVSAAFKNEQQKSIRAAMQKNFSCYFEGESADFTHYLNVATQNYVYELGFLEKTINVFSELESRNKKHSWFDETVLHERLSEVLFSLFTHFASRGIRCKLLYLRSGYTALAKINKLTFLKFIVK